MSKFRLAMVQMFVEPGDKARNLTHARDLIAQASNQGANLVLLPEVFDLGWTHPAALTDAAPIPGGDSCQMLASAARTFGAYVCGGITERSGETVYNSAVIVAPSGEIIAHHRKLNELDIAHHLYAQGDRLGVTQTELGTLGLMICADGFATDRVVSRTLGYMGADVILAPSSWAVPPDHDNAITPYGDEWRDAFAPVARAFAVSVIGVSNVGPITAGAWSGWRCIGCSLAVGPDGSEIVQGPYGVGAETILLIDVEPVERPARGTGWAALWED
jgi:predicted amidohydrolase